METLIQAGVNGARVTSVDIGINSKTRESRLFKSMPEFVFKTGLTILTMFIYYRPGVFFSLIGSLFMSFALMIGGRFIYLVYIAEPVVGRTYVPSLILLSILILTALLFIHWQCLALYLGHSVGFQRNLYSCSEKCLIDPLSACQI